MTLEFLLILPLLSRLDFIYCAVPIITDPDPSGTTTISIAENTTIGDTVYIVIASDPDGDNLTYIAFDGAAKFTITSSGVLRTANVFDYEDTNDQTHDVVIQVSDGVNDVNASMSVYITDVNDNSPQFSTSNYGVTVDENTPTGTSLIELNCTDIDSGVNGECTVVIQSGDDDPSKFNIVGQTIFTTTIPTDYETTNNYNLVVVGQDNPTSGSPNMATASVSVTVIDINEAPCFTSNPTVTVSENSTVPFHLYSYQATEDDKVFPNNIIASYQKQTVSNGGSDIFQIFAFSGAVRVISSLDYETAQMYEITVVVTDNGGLQGTGTLTVSIEDENDNTPMCSTTMTNVSISENKVTRSTAGLYPFSNSSTVTSLECTDADSGVNSQLSYVLTVNPDNTFDITQTGDTASIVVNGNIDYDKRSSYQLEVRVSDNGVSVVLSTTATINIYILEYVATPWIQTAEGIATAVTCSVIGAALLIGGAVFIKFCLIKKR